MSNGFLTRLSAILIIVVLLLLYILGCSKVKDGNKIKEQTNLITALNDTLKVTKYSDSSQKATIQSFTTSRVEDFLSMKVKDSAINALQSLVDKYKSQLKEGGSAIVIKGETGISAIGTTTIEHTSYDTVNNPVFPIYKAHITNKWFTIDTRADRDTTKVDLKVFNVYDVVLAKEKGEWVAMVTNYNPYSSIETVRAYSVEVPKTKQKRVNLAIFGGYGFNLQGQVRSTPIIGAGISYTILSLF